MEGREKSKKMIREECSVEIKMGVVCPEGKQAEKKKGPLQSKSTKPPPAILQNRFFLKGWIHDPFFNVHYT